MVEILNVRRFLKNARHLYKESGIKFGFAKTWLVESEFVLDLYYEHRLSISGYLD